MKRRLMSIFAAALMLGTVAADSATIKLPHDPDHAGALAIIGPDAGERGAFNIYMAALFQGTIYFRGLTTTSWTAYASGDFPVAQTVNLVGAPALVRVVDFDLAVLPGLSLYVGYGATQADMLSKSDHVAWIYTVPTVSDTTTTTETGATTTSTASTTTTTHAGGATDGPGLFKQYCNQCHTIDELAGRSKEEIVASIPRVPSKDFLKVLTDLELDAIADYTQHPDHY